MSLRLIMEGGQLKHFKAALVSLGKIGAEISLEAVPDRLILRSLNTAKSAHMTVTFNSQFFDGYDIFQSSIVQAGILMKNMMAAFRTQRVKRMLLELDADASNLTVTLTCDHGLLKRYKLECMEVEILQANTDKDSFPTFVVAEAFELNKLLATFQSSLDEITIIANPETGTSAASRHRACQLQSYYDPCKGQVERTLRTQLHVDTRSVFLSYQHNAREASDVTFNFKDFRAMVTLCEQLNANVAIRFEQPGSPLVAEPHFKGAQEVDIYAELVLATLMDSQAAHQAAPSPATAQRQARPGPEQGAPEAATWQRPVPAGADAHHPHMQAEAGNGLDRADGQEEAGGAGTGTVLRFSNRARRGNRPQGSYEDGSDQQPDAAVADGIDGGEAPGPHGQDDMDYDLSNPDYLPGRPPVAVRHEAVAQQGPAANEMELEELDELPATPPDDGQQHQDGPNLFALL